MSEATAADALRSLGVWKCHSRRHLKSGLDPLCTHSTPEGKGERASAGERGPAVPSETSAAWTPERCSEAAGGPSGPALGGGGPRLRLGQASLEDARPVSAMREQRQPKEENEGGKAFHVNGRNDETGLLRQNGL